MRYFLIALIFLAACGQGVIAQPKKGSMHKGKMDFKSELNLSDEQTDAMKKIKTKSAKDMVDLTSALKKKRIDMRSIMYEDEPDRSAMEKLMREMSDLTIQKKLLAFDTRQSIKNLLDDEQKEKFKKMRKKRGRGMKSGKKGPMRGRMNGNMHEGMREGMRMHGFSPD
jgi:Spy/CpxP family protein refolding chaperone